MDRNEWKTSIDYWSDCWKLIRPSFAMAGFQEASHGDFQTLPSSWTGVLRRQAGVHSGFLGTKVGGSYRARLNSIRKKARLFSFVASTLLGILCAFFFEAPRV